ncbi:heat shock [Musa troglodytarum]|uniref:Heat shock n=1 Tax=Musa troglodytarum TaxID=320322 RepID=A0A9E7L6G8_9LILI|nr:heat shock [Musa troglodytarum]
MSSVSGLAYACWGNNVLDAFSIEPWDPFDGLPFRSFSFSFSFVGARVDRKETPEAHVFRASLRGLKREEVRVEVEDRRVLRISAERSRHRVGRSGGRFLRRFRLPENARTEQVRTAMENGVLTVTVPKGGGLS